MAIAYEIRTMNAEFPNTPLVMIIATELFYLFIFHTLKCQMIA